MLAAVSAFTPGILGLAVPIVAFETAKRRAGHQGTPTSKGSTGSTARGAPSGVHVPDVVGVRWGEAQSRLSALDLSPTQVGVYSDAKSGTVVSQSPVADRQVPLRSHVTLRVSKGLPPPPPPPAYNQRKELERIEGLVEQVLNRLPAATSTSALSDTGESKQPSPVPPTHRRSSGEAPG
jgi:beta-lactam-binding protein with PASTA domain